MFTVATVSQHQRAEGADYRDNAWPGPEANQASRRIHVCAGSLSACIYIYISVRVLMNTFLYVIQRFAFGLTL